MSKTKLLTTTVHEVKIEGLDQIEDVTMFNALMDSPELSHENSGTLHLLQEDGGSTYWSNMLDDQVECLATVDFKVTRRSHVFREVVEGEIDA